MSILIRKAGIFTTVQDLGRPGKRQFGINPGGAMDRKAVQLLNVLLQNAANAALLEIYFPAGELIFESKTSFAIGGADLEPELSGKAIANWTVHHADQGDVLKFRQRKIGNRAYLSVNGGFLVDRWLGSSSTNLAAGVGGFEGRRLMAGDRIRCENRESEARISLGESMIPPYSRSPRIRITPGPEFDLLTGISLETLVNREFQVSKDSDRMGYRLNGPPLYKISNFEMLSSGTTFGTIQLLPDSQLIVLMADHQTTGGYPRIATVTTVDLSLLAQLGPGDKIHFHLIKHPDGERLLCEYERSLDLLRAGVKLKTNRKL